MIEALMWIGIAAMLLKNTKIKKYSYNNTDSY